jgi:hypothetical protein
VANDTDPDTALNSDLRVAVGSITNVHGGTAVLQADGRTVRFTPTPGLNSSNTPGGFGFSYRANDGFWSVDPTIAMSGDSNSAAVTVTVTAPLTYVITITPLKTPANLGSAVPIEWKLKDSLGNNITSLSTLLKMESVFNGAVPPSGCVASATGTRETLYNLPNGATGGSTFRSVSGGFKFNWDTTTAATEPIKTDKGCYTVLIYLSDLSAAKMTSAVRLK